MCNRTLSSDVTRTDILKILLYAPGASGISGRPVRGKTRLQKEVFLAQKALKDRGIKRKYSFMPYHYGPFSRQLYFDINWLRSKGLVKERTYLADRTGLYREFKLTPEGTREVESLIQKPEFKEVYEIVREVRRKYDEMPLEDLVEFTHREFPAYVGKER